jgi:hypothetical protein
MAVSVEFPSSGARAAARAHPPFVALHGDTPHDRYQHIQVPAQGQKITVNADMSLNVPDQPIIPYIEGDGTGLDITPVMIKVVDAAVAKAYGGKRKIHWMEVYAGEKSTRSTAPTSGCPRKPGRAADYVVSIKGPLTTPVGGGIRSLNVALRQELDLYVCLRPVQYFKGVPSPVKEPEKTNMVIFRENSRTSTPASNTRPRATRRRSSSSSCRRWASRRSAFPKPRASASSRCRARAPSAWCARPSSTPSTTTSPA